GSAWAQANFSTGAGPNDSAAAPGPDQPVDYDAWRVIAEESETLIGTPGVSEVRLEQMRAELVDWRERFLSAQGANSSRIATLRGQIEALGPVPAEGATEPEEIAALRGDLNAQLQRLQAPGISAVEAHSRA